MDVNSLHNKAMDIAEKAYLSKIKGDMVEFVSLSKEACALEARAANLLLQKYDTEPSRSILYRSAATLAMDCGEFREAERLIAAGLMGTPPEDIAEELRDLLENVHFSRHMELRGVALEQDECQLSISGASVGFGIALTDEFVERVQTFEKLLYRTAERKLGKSFREKGKLPKVIADNYPVFMSIPRAASFAVTFKLGKPTNQLTLDLPYMNTSSEIVEEVVACFELLNKSDDEALKSRFNDNAYYNNFLGLAKLIAPDGKAVTQVGLTLTRKGSDRRVPLTRPKKAMPTIEAKAALQGSGEHLVVTGNFLFANSMGKDNKIRLKDEAGNKYDVIVPAGMMADIVKPLYEELVVVTGIRKKNAIELQDIRKADD